MSGSAVINGVLQYVSPSQIKTHERCNRKWYFEKILKLRQPEDPNGPTALGTKIHSQIQKWYEQGTPPEHPSALLATETILPSRNVYLNGDLRVEWPPDISQLGVKIGDMPVYGRIDLLDSSHESYLTVIDIKSTSAFKYAKNRTELETDLQLTVYADAANKLRPETDSGPVRVQHAYVLTRGTGALPSEASLSETLIAETLSSYVPVVEQMKATAALPEYKQANPNWDACFDYHKTCPFHGICTGAKTLTNWNSDSTENAEVPDSSPAASPKNPKRRAKAEVTYKVVTLKRGVTINKGSFNSARLDVELTAEISGDLTEAYETVSADVNRLLTEEKGKE